MLPFFLVCVNIPPSFSNSCTIGPEFSVIFSSIFSSAGDIDMHNAPADCTRIFLLFISFSLYFQRKLAWLLVSLLLFCYPIPLFYLPSFLYKLNLYFCIGIDSWWCNLKFCTDVHRRWSKTCSWRLPTCQREVTMHYIYRWNRCNWYKAFW